MSDPEPGHGASFVSFFTTVPVVLFYAVSDARGGRDAWAGLLGAAFVAVVLGMLGGGAATFLARQLERGATIGFTTGAVFGLIGVLLMLCL